MNDRRAGDRHGIAAQVSAPTADFFRGVLASRARSCDIDLIVMGTHGRCGFAHTMLGRVAERTIRTAPCPVLTVRALMTPLDAAMARPDVAVSVA